MALASQHQRLPTPAGPAARVRPECRGHRVFEPCPLLAQRDPSPGWPRAIHRSGRVREADLRGLQALGQLTLWESTEPPVIGEPLHTQTGRESTCSWYVAEKGRAGKIVKVSLIMFVQRHVFPAS